MTDTTPNQNWPGGVAAITLFCEDLETTAAFYERAFGQTNIFADDNSTVYKVGSTLINLLRTTAADELVAPEAVAQAGGGARAVYTIEVDDVDAMCERLAANGVELLNGPMDRPWGIRTASFRDPSGHVWEIGK